MYTYTHNYVYTFISTSAVLMCTFAQVFYTACVKANVPKRATQLLFATEQLVELYAEDHGRCES